MIGGHALADAVLLGRRQVHEITRSLRQGQQRTGFIILLLLGNEPMLTSWQIKYLRVPDEIIEKAKDQQQGQQGNFRGRGGQSRGDHGGRGGDRGRGGRGQGRGRGRGRGA